MELMKKSSEDVQDEMERDNVMVYLDTNNLF